MTQNKYTRYTVAPVAVILALGCRMLLNLVLHDASPFMFFFVAILVSTWLGGLGPGLFATALSALAVDYFYLPPIGTVLIGSPKEILQFLPFTILGAVVCMIVYRMQREQQRAEQAAIKAREGETEARQAESALRQSEENLALRNAELSAERQRWQGVVEGIADEVWVCDAQGKISLMNLATVTAMKLEAFKDKTVYEVYEEVEILNPDGQLRPPEQAPLLRALKDEVVRGEEIMRHRRTGITRWRQFSAAPTRDATGAITGAVAIVRDITDVRRMETALRENEEQLRLATTAAEIGVWSWTPGTSNVIVSANWRKLFGIAPETEVTFETWRAALHPDDRDRAVAELNAASEEHREFNVEYRVVRPDGTMRWIVDRGRAWYDEHDRPAGMAGVNVDITERQKAEEALRESEHRYRSLFENMIEGYAYCQMMFDDHGVPEDFIYLKVNKVFGQLTGLNDVESRKVTEVIPGIREAHPELFELYGRVALTGQPEKIEIEFKPLDTWFSISVYSPSRGTFVAVFENISERKRAEEALRASEQRWATTLASIGDAVIATDVEGKISFMNTVAEATTGWKLAEALTRPITDVFDIVNEQTRARVEDPVSKVLREGKIVGLANHTVLLSKNRTEVPIDDSGAPIRDRDGKINGVVLVFRDITERKRVDAALRQSEERRKVAEYARSLLEASLDPLVTIAADGKITDVNEATIKATGLAREELIGTDFSGYFTEPEKAQAGYQRVFAEGYVTDYPLTLRHKDGRLMDVLYNASVYKDSNGDVLGVFAAARDITERKRAEAAVFGERQRFLDVLETLPVIIALFRPDHRIVWVNRAYRDALGENVGQLCYASQFGREKPCEECQAFVPLQTGQPHNWQWTLPNGRTFDIYNFPFADADGSPMILEMDLDITEQRQAEAVLRDTNATLERRVAERTSALAEADRRKDEFLAMLAHELRNPLTPVRYAVQIMNAYCGSHCANHERMAQQRNIIERQIGHMAHLIDDLLDVARITSGKIELRREMLDLNAALRQSMEACRLALENKNQELITSLPDDPLWVDGDQTRLEQVFTNLLVNASKYSPAGKRIWISASSEKRQGSGAMAIVHVRDEGEGISPDLLPHIFELFTQGERGLDRAQGGLGIGLTMVQKLVELHGGSVEVHSAGLGKGCEMTVHLPLMATEPELAVPSQVETPLADRVLKILAVDDVVDTAQTLSDLLGMWGHQTRTAFDGFAALEIARTWHPDIVLLDIGMPGMDGYEVARRLRAEYAGNSITIVALTGYGQESDRAGAQAAGFNDLLVKPVDLDALRDVLARM